MAALPVLVVVLVIAAITFWDKREQARMHRERARVPLVSAELRSQVGDAIADLLVATRRLHADVSELELSARVMLAEEPHGLLPSGARRFERQVADANFLSSLRKLRRAGQGWIEQVAAIPKPERRRLQIDLDELQELFELPWAERKPVNDRSAEIRLILELCSSAKHALAQIDVALRAPADSPYRSDL